MLRYVKVTVTSRVETLPFQAASDLLGLLFEPRHSQRERSVTVGY
jgi:hypothetical protein